MKLFGYEVYKVWKKRLFSILVLSLLIVNGFFYSHSQLDEQKLLIQSRDAYSQMEKEYASLGIKEGVAKVAKQEQFLTLYSTFVQENVGTQDSVWNQLVADAKKENLEAYEQYKQSNYFNNELLIHRDSFLTQAIKEQYTHQEQFHEEMKAMSTRAEEMLSVSIFYEEDSYSYRNIGKTVVDFESLRNLPLKLGLEEGVTTGTSFWSTDLSMAVLLFLLCTILFYFEREEGLTPLILSTRNGKFRTYAAKISVLSLLTILLAIMFYGSILILANHFYGFGDLNRYIQSMSSFSRVVQPITVEQYLSQYMLLKIAVNLLFVWSLTALFLVLRHTSRIYLALVLILGSSYICYTLIHPNSYINILKYMNAVAFYDTFHIIADYRNLNLFGYPIRKDIAILLVGGGLMFIMPILCGWLYVAIGGKSVRPFGLRWSTQLRGYLFRKRRTNSLILHESFKFLIAGKSIIILLFAGIISYQNVELEERQFDMKSVIYNQYLSQLTGEINEDKLMYLREEREKFTVLPEQLAFWKTQYSSNKIDLPTYNQEKIKIEEFAKQEESFEYVEKQANDLIRLQEERGITGGFVNVISSDELFNRQKADVLDGMIYSLLLLIGLSPLFALDYRNGMMMVLRTTRNGRWGLFASKYVLAYLYGIALLVVIQFSKFFNVLTQYPKMDWHAPIQSIDLLSHVDWAVSIIEYVIIASLLQLVGVLIIIHVILYLSVILKKQMLLLMVATAVLVLPFCLQYMGMNEIGRFSFNFIFQLHYSLESVHYSMGIVIYYGILIAIGVAASWRSWVVFNSFSRKGD